MWPWEHLAVGYLLYSAWCRVVWKRPPTTRGALVVGFASVLPDLIDKPLSWWLHVLPSGRSLAHSLLTFLPLAVLVVLLGARVNSQKSSVAFIVGYASHLAGDVAYPLALRGEFYANFLLWPLMSVGGDTERVLPHLRELVAAFVEFLGTPRGSAYLVGELALLALTFAVWLRDGTPVLRALWRRRNQAVDS